MNENYEDSWEYLDPISNEDLYRQVNKGRAVPILDGDYDD
jgi:hypothetical protein